LAAGIASPQTSVPSLQQYLSLTTAQVQSINDLNNQLSQYSSKQQAAYNKYSSTAYSELAKDSPDPSVVGNAYAQMETIRRAFNTQWAQTQSQVGALLTVDQAMRIGGLLNVLRLQPLVTEAICTYLEPAVPTAVFRAAFVSYVLVSPVPACSVPPVPTALANYLNLTDNQISAIENTIAGNQDYTSRQNLKITEIQNDIKDLTAAATIDPVALGADYVLLKQIQSDEATQSGQLMPTVRSILSDQQQPQLQSLDQALKLDSIATSAVDANILVLPPDLVTPNGCGLASASYGFAGSFVFSPSGPALPVVCWYYTPNLEGLGQ
jgi:Spy/CpxP family protein refolding chaperone